MLLVLVKFFVAALGIGIAWAIVVCIFAVNADRPDRDRRLREEGYDSCVYDILHFGKYWDREHHKYIKIDKDSQEKQTI